MFGSIYFSVNIFPTNPNNLDPIVRLYLTHSREEREKQKQRQRRKEGRKEGRKETANKEKNGNEREG